MFRGVFILFAIAFTVIGPLVYAGPQLASDLGNGAKWVLVDDLAIKESRCTRWYYVVSTCHIEYINRRNPAQMGGTLNYLVFGSWSGERARLLRSPTNPNVIGTTLGVEHLQQRVITISIFALLSLAFLLFLLRSLLAGGKPREPAVGSAKPA